MGIAVTAPSPASSFPSPCFQAPVSKPICTPIPAPNPSGTRRLRHSIPGTPRGCQGSLKSPGTASQLVPPHLHLLRQMGPQEGGLASGTPLWSAPGVGSNSSAGGWNLWDRGPGLNNVRMMPQARAVGSGECPCPRMPIPCGD